MRSNAPSSRRSNSINRFQVINNQQKAQGSTTGSFFFCIAWLFIFAWISFLAYCWYNGLINQQKIQNLVSNVDLVLNRTEETLFHHPHGLLKAVQVGKRSHPPPSEDDVIIVFSTDCSPYQDWQTLVMFHSAQRVRQKGRVIRIASGCDEAKQKALTDLYQALYGENYYYAHFTPDFKKDAKTNRKYDFYNKPWGLKHWLENANPPIPEHAIIALLDPDMIFLRPITPYIASMPYLKSKRIPDSEVFTRIEEGHPVAQTYGLGAPWTNDNHRHFKRGKICGEGSPCLEPNERFGELHYSVGPPYILEKSDFIRLANSWTMLVPRVYEDYPYLLAEMYAYSMAAAHERLPHLQLDHYMVSNIESGGEGWDWVDALDNVCLPPEQTEKGQDPEYYPGHNLPTVVHFCQSYRQDGYFYSKRKVPHNLFSCDQPLFVDIPSTTGRAQYTIDWTTAKKEELKAARKSKRNTFMLCSIYSAINLALIDYKQKMCSGPGVTANYAKTLKL